MNLIATPPNRSSGFVTCYTTICTVKIRGGLKIRLSDVSIDASGPSRENSAMLRGVLRSFALRFARSLRFLVIAVIAILSFVAWVFLGSLLAGFQDNGGTIGWLFDHAGRFMLGPGLLLALVAFAAWRVTVWFRRRDAAKRPGQPLS